MTLLINYTLINDVVKYFHRIHTIYAEGAFSSTKKNERIAESLIILSQDYKMDTCNISPNMTIVDKTCLSMNEYTELLTKSRIIFAGFVVVFWCWLCLLCSPRSYKSLSNQKNTPNFDPTKPIYVVGICGLAGSGKDTCADYLIKEHGFHKASFASTLKDMIAVLFSWDREMLEGSTTESREAREQVDEYWSNALDIPELTPRKVLQQCDHFHTEMWIESLKRKIEQGHYGNRVVIPDVRFHNEAYFINAFKETGIIIRIERNPLPEWYSRIKGGDDPDNVPDLPHESEWRSVNCENVTIYNNFTIDTLFDQLDDVLEEKFGSEFFEKYDCDDVADLYI